ncbi:macrophage mannose receptor 1-like [Saccostrea echinata]|uniref:macrophage mannose receptor 1-like n=1 Tax=Saccostrea echinata TaxID=191078 RepID=UPI002A7FD35D|nr:macrophage mannose receptor 1-like [Saccostrea echinata]
MSILNVVIIVTCVFEIFSFFTDGAIPGNMYYGRKADVSSEFSKLSPFGLQQCVRSCFLEGSCKSVNYNRNQLTCYLIDEDLGSDSLVGDGDYIFISNITGTQDLMKGCVQNSCLQQESCVILKNATTCIKTFCRHGLYSFYEKTKSCLRIVSHPALNWTDAEGFCQRDGGHLVSLETENKTNLVVELLNYFKDYKMMNIYVYFEEKLLYGYLTAGLGSSVTRFWIGLSDRETEGTFKWIAGHPVGFSNWNKGQPNDYYVRCVTNSSDADCAITRTNGKWADDCCETPHGFICEII